MHADDWSLDMNNQNEIKITDNDMLTSTLVFAVLSSILVIPLILVFKNPLFEQAQLSITLSSGIIWGIFAIAAVFGFWNLYYIYIYRPWMRWLTPLDFIIYGAVGLGMWWLSIHLTGSAVLWFVLLGGLEGVLEHIFGVYVLRILDKVPWLEGAGVLPVLTFSFFEYTFYWAIIAWFAYLGSRLFNI